MPFLFKKVFFLLILLFGIINKRNFVTYLLSLQNKTKTIYR